MQSATKKIKNLGKLFVLIIALFSYSSIFAASLSLNPATGAYNTGDNFSVRLRVSSPDQSINAVSANINFSNDTLSLVSISKSGSIMTLWPVEPSFINQAGQASVDGVAISGFTGSSGTVVTLNFRAVKEGPAYVRLSSSSVLANDGNGTNVLEGSSGSNFNIQKNDKLTTEPKQVVVKKIQTPQITSLPNVIKIEQVDPSDESGGNNGRASFLITPPRTVKDNTYDIQIDSEKIFSYIDDGSSTYTTPVLGDGNHTIRVSAKDYKDNSMVGITEFTILPIIDDGQAVVKPSFKTNLLESSWDFVVYMFVIVLILIIILILGFLKIRKAKKALNKKITDAKKTIGKTFSLLEEDESEENRLIRKLKNRKVLSEDDEASIDQFSKDLSEAEKVIIESLNELKDDQ